MDISCEQLISHSGAIYLGAHLLEQRIESDPASHVSAFDCDKKFASRQQITAIDLSDCQISL